MKTLLLLRHAQPAQTSPTGRDFDRPLIASGRTEAALVGHFLARRKLTPATAISSPAARARETAALVVEAARLFTTTTRFDERLYNADTGRILEVVSEVEAEVETVLVVGHNPGLAELIAHLTGESKRVSPATLACLCLDIKEWGEVLTATGRLAFALPPEALEDN
jgi:phosphohistidine phosphatase